MAHRIKQKDLTEQRFGKLVALYVTRETCRGDYWHCRCDCGNEKDVRCDSLLKGTTRSCGCLSKENKAYATKHGMWNKKIYSKYYGMHQRCENQNSNGYKYYGARGIKISDEWCGENGFLNFFEWSMNNGYKDELTLDRIDTDGNYEPSNCRWVTRKTQQQNLRRNVMVTCDGERLSLQEASFRYGIRTKTIYSRLKRGWSDEKAIKTPLNKKMINKKYR